MNFEQKIRYLDYVSAGTRVRSAGFVRVEIWGKACKFILQISSLQEVRDGSYPVYAYGSEGQWDFGRLTLERGKGRLELHGQEIAIQKDFHAGDVVKLEIPLGNDGKLLADLSSDAGRRNAACVKDTTEAPKGGESVEAPKDGETAEAPKGGETKGGAEPTAKEPRSGEVQGEAGETKEAEKEVQEEAEAAPEEAKEKPKEAELTAEGQESCEAYGYYHALKPGKWEQLTAIYPPISPFGDARKYLQISPGDFVILKDRSYRMVNNSFLLHGYFTYKHLILHKMNRRGETAYYVGVPGSFYNKEKEVAILFGFESFEGATEPAREGDFGYYMMRVEI